MHMGGESQVIELMEAAEVAEVVEAAEITAFRTAPLVLDRAEGTPSPATHIAWSFLHT
jgi:hypothetical protein